MTTEQLAEESLIDLTYAILDDKKSTITFDELLKSLQQLNGASDEYMQEQLLQFYTDMNIDGRFLLNQENQWGLREWYKVEQIEEETAPTVKTRKKKAKVVAEDDLEEIEVDEEDLVFEEDYEEFVDEDEDEDEDADDDADDVLDFDAVVDEDDLEDIDEDDLEDDIEEEIEIEDEEFELEEELEEDDLEIEDDLK